MPEFIVPIIIAVVLLIILIRCIRVVPQARACVIERLGAYSTTWGVGLHFKLPFIERIARTVSLKEQVVDFPPQPVITKDNVTMQIDTVIYFEITDPKLYTYGVEHPLTAIENLTATTLRNIVGELELDQCLTSRDIINTKIRTILDEATDPWGIKVNRVELKNIMPPKEIQNAMERQMKAERERREAILQAEGEKKSAILIAEGEKESAILRADAKKQAAILEAEGQAEAILKVQEATAQALKLPPRSSSRRRYRASPAWPRRSKNSSPTTPRPSRRRKSKTLDMKKHRPDIRTVFFYFLQPHPSACMNHPSNYALRER